MRKGVPWHQIARGLSIENLDHETENQGKTFWRQDVASAESPSKLDRELSGACKRKGFKLLLANPHGTHCVIVHLDLTFDFLGHFHQLWPLKKPPPSHAW